MKINYLILTFFVMWSNLSADNKNYDTNNISYKSVLDRALDEYIDIIDLYTEALTDDNYIEILDSGLKNSLNWLLLREYIRANNYGDFGIYFALGDVDKNGIPELFIGGDYETEVPHVYDIFVFDKTKGKAIKPFYDVFGELGERQRVFYLYNEIIEVHWSSSAWNTGMEFYKLSSDGYSMEFIESISTDIRTVDGEFVTKYFHDREGTIEITEEKFNLILDGYWGEKNRMQRKNFKESPENLSWIEIKP